MVLNRTKDITWGTLAVVLIAVMAFYFLAKGRF